MPPDRSKPADDTQSSPGDDVESSIIDRIDRCLTTRREFLKGLLIGGVGVGGMGTVISQLPEGGFQSLATLAGGDAGVSSATYHLPAVDAAGSGLIVTLTIEPIERNGLFVNLNGVELRHDLQMALREAVTAAHEDTGISASANGWLVSFTAPGENVMVLRGKSWEAGLRVGVTAALNGLSPPKETLVTGVVTDDGQLLPVSGIEAKARAAQAFGASRLLVPEEQTRSVPGITVEGIKTIERVIDMIIRQ